MSDRHPGSRHHAALDRRRWALTRLRAFERDSWGCTGCGRAGKLEGHHLIELQNGGDPYDTDNVRTLCRDCHIKAHARPRTAAEEAWRALVRELD